MPELARACLAALGAQLRRLKEKILEFDRMSLAGLIDSAGPFLREKSGCTFTLTV